MASAKLPLGRVQTSTFEGDQMQKQARLASQKANSLEPRVATLENTAYAALAANTTIGVAAYATLLTATITTVLASGYLDLQFTVSGVQVTSAGTAYFTAYVDGTAAVGAYTTVAAGAAFCASAIARVRVRAGRHTVRVDWRSSVANARINAATVTEEHARLFVREAA